MNILFTVPVGQTVCDSLTALLLMLCVILDQCLIEAQAYGANRYGQRRYGYVKLNGLAVWQSSWQGEYPNRRGVNVIVVDPSSCTMLNSRNYDTFGDTYAARRLRDHLLGLSDGTGLVVVSADEASRYLRDALSTLGRLGADVSDVRYRGAWVFVAKKGDPARTVLDKERDETSANRRQPQVTASFAGAYCDLLLFFFITPGSKDPGG